MTNFRLPFIKPEQKSPMNKVRQKRFEKTLSFVKKHLKTDEAILDLGKTNELSDFLRQNGYVSQSVNDRPLNALPDRIQHKRNWQLSNPKSK